MAERFCTSVTSRRALLGVAMALPALTATAAAGRDCTSSSGPLALEVERDRALAVVNTSAIDNPPEIQAAWTAQHAILDSPCGDRAMAAAKLRALLHPEIGLPCWHDLDEREERALRQVLGFLTGEG